MFKRQRFDVFHDQSDDKGSPTFYVVLPATSHSYEIAELKIKALGLSAGKRGFLEHGIPYVGRSVQFTGFTNTKEEIRLFLYAIRYREYDYDYNSAIVHHPLSDDYFKIPSYDDLMRQIKSKKDFRTWREGLFN
jgi:hypothetical protein